MTRQSETASRFSPFIFTQAIIGGNYLKGCFKAVKISQGWEQAWLELLREQLVTIEELLCKEK